MPVDPHRNSRFWGGLETQVAGDELAIQYGTRPSSPSRAPPPNFKACGAGACFVTKPLFGCPLAQVDSEETDSDSGAESDDGAGVGRGVNLS